MRSSAGSIVWSRLEQLAEGHTPSDRFDPVVIETLPVVVRRYLNTALAAGTVLASTAEIEMRGRIKVGRWLPFHAHQLLAPLRGTVWQANVARLISGSDRYVDGEGGMDWRLFGRLRLVHSTGPDVSRSSAERAAGESLWVPSALVGQPGVTWSELDANRIAVEFATDDHPVRVEHELDAAGRIVSSRFDRWGDPDGTGTWARHPFGVEVTDTRDFHGVTIPAAGRVGWHAGTPRWEDGIFFTFEITNHHLVEGP